MREVLAIAGLAAIVVAAATFSETTPFPGSAALLPVLGTAAVVAAGTAARPTLTGRALGFGVPRYVGRISYGWYLWHWPCLVLAAAWATNRYGDVPAAVTVFAVVLSLALAIGSHYVVEMPVRRSVRLGRAPRITLAFGAALTVMTAALAVSLPRRAIPVARQVAAAAVETGPVQPATPATRLEQDPAFARVDWGVQPGSCLAREEWDSRVVCIFGDRAEPNPGPARRRLPRRVVRPRPRTPRNGAPLAPRGDRAQLLPDLELPHVACRHG